MNKNAISGLAIAAIAASAVLATAVPASALVNPAPDESPVAFTAYVDEAYAGTVTATLTGGTWDWGSGGSNYRFSTSADCAVGFGDVAPTSLTFSDYGTWPDQAWIGSFDVTGTPVAADAVGGPLSDGVYPLCVDIRDDEGDHSFLAMTVTIMERPVVPPAVETPVLSATGVDSTLMLGLGLSVALLAGIGGVAVKASRRRTAR